MFNYTLPWKSFNVSLEKVSEWLTANVPGYSALSASGCLIIHLTQELSEEESIALNTYWDNLTELSIEATSYYSREDIATRLQLIKAALVVKSWDNMSSTERKILLSLQVTNTELFAVEV